METIVEILKYLAPVLGGLAAITGAIAKYFHDGRIRPRRDLKARYLGIKAFFEDGGINVHPFLMECAFAAAIGHARLSAEDIPLVLRQKNPSSFISAYLSIRHYLAPNSNESRFELRGLAARPRLRNLAKYLGLGSYIVLVAASMWLLYRSVEVAAAGAWSQFGGYLVLTFFFAALAAYCLIQASHLHWAVKLFDAQI